jgi:hypothetical protein
MPRTRKKGSRETFEDKLKLGHGASSAFEAYIDADRHDASTFGYIDSIGIHILF